MSPSKANRLWALVIVVIVVLLIVIIVVCFWTRSNVPPIPGSPCNTMTVLPMGLTCENGTAKILPGYNGCTRDQDCIIGAACRLGQCQNLIRGGPPPPSPTDDTDDTDDSSDCPCDDTSSYTSSEISSRTTSDSRTISDDTDTDTDTDHWDEFSTESFDVRRGLEATAAISTVTASREFSPALEEISLPSTINSEESEVVRQIELSPFSRDGKRIPGIPVAYSVFENGEAIFVLGPDGLYETDQNLKIIRRINSNVELERVARVFGPDGNFLLIGLSQGKLYYLTEIAGDHWIWEDFPGINNVEEIFPSPEGKFLAVIFSNGVVWSQRIVDAKLIVEQNIQVSRAIRSVQIDDSGKLSLLHSDGSTSINPGEFPSDVRSGKCHQVQIGSHSYTIAVK